MHTPNRETLAKVAAKLNTLGLNYAFAGGTVLGFLLDRPELVDVRPTYDVDIIVEILAAREYAVIEEKLRRAGFTHDTGEGAPLCRWRYHELIVDVMPTAGAWIGLNTKYFADALETAQVLSVNGIAFKIISPVAFLALKLVAFEDRGRGDYFAAKDLEDIITVIDGREIIVREVAAGPEVLQRYIADSVRKLLEIPDFDEALAGHLPPDSASQARRPLLMKKLKDLAAL